jgi:dipeptidyl aminopeptidase/acylaminoacyl peptidase
MYHKDSGGDERWELHVVDIKSYEDRVLIPEKCSSCIFQMSNKAPDEIVIGLNNRDPRYWDLYRMNILTGEKTLIWKNDKAFQWFLFDEDYKLRFASISKDDGGVQYFKANFNKNEGEYFWESFMELNLEDVATTQLLSISEDGKTLYFTDSRGQDLNALKEMNLLDGSEKIIAQSGKAEIGNIRKASNGEVGAYFTNYLYNEWFFFDKELESHWNSVRELIGDDFFVPNSLDCNKWIVGCSANNGPYLYYLYTKEGRTLEPLFNSCDVVNKYRFAKTEGVVIKARDGLDLPSYLTRPVDFRGKTPLVVLVHGGPWSRDCFGYSPVVQLLANRGFSVLQVNYRGSTGFGKSFLSKGNLEWGGKMHDDILDGVEWAIKEGVADPTKIGIAGMSYGGYESLWAATQSGDVFRCAVDVVGPSNLERLLQTIPSWDLSRKTTYLQIGDPYTDEGAALLKDRSPLFHVDKITIPILIVQGANDPRVPRQESEQIVAAMKEKGLPYIYMLFLDEGHGFARPENNIAFYAVAERFLADNLRARYEPLHNELEESTLDQKQKKALQKRFK